MSGGTFIHASNGFIAIRFGGGERKIQTMLTNVEYSSQAPGNEVVTISGNVGFPRPSARIASVQATFAVPVIDADRKLLRAAYDAHEIVDVAYHTAGSVYGLAGVMRDWRSGTVANQPDSFSVTINGADKDGA